MNNFDMLDLITIGEIINTHGVRGELKILPLTDDPKRFKLLKKVIITSKEASETPLMSEIPATPEMPQTLEIQDIKYFKNFVILKFKDIDSIDSAEKYKKALIKIDRADAVKLPKDSYFIFDLIGIDVYDENDAFIGGITNVLQTGSNDCYNIRRNDGFEFYLPALKTVVLNVDVEDRKMTVRIPKGLLD